MVILGIISTGKFKSLLLDLEWTALDFFLYNDARDFLESKKEKKKGNMSDW